ncbi:unnamed protein product [Adineta ricciae]|uniref:Uncharacterized protein n=1 Tax=Adineta ricciae TaxID=249248 RepID=A0A815V1Y6_ADIRI|nr:unnamed protein product [Adineta ricciae]CAF1530284.1 unnamed protein product [Adineta ricciae]
MNIQSSNITWELEETSSRLNLKQRLITMTLLAAFGEDFYDPSFAHEFIDIVIHYLPYFSSFLFPLVALIGLPEIRAELKKISRQQTIALNTINPLNL